ncbi:uncharacterized protein LOC141898641 [Tubulanus polymorphus]|uniref:uncharacterized protein LOC141898641 n=1 Tax=Tubulanus polymorphus TaxID=672921 RepID=UPI003DA45E8B
MSTTDYEEFDIGNDSTRIKQDKNEHKKYNVYFEKSTIKFQPSEIRENDDDIDETTSLLLVQKTDRTNTIKDRFNYVFFVALIEGMGIILPWHLFMCSKAITNYYQPEMQIIELISSVMPD